MRITGFTDLENAGWGGPQMGLPTCRNFGNALGVWVCSQERPVTISEAAKVFNVEPRLIWEALDEHPWLVMVDDGTIGPDYYMIDDGKQPLHFRYDDSPGVYGASDEREC